MRGFFSLPACLLGLWLSCNLSLSAADLQTIAGSEGGDAGLVVLVEPSSPDLAIALAGAGRYVVSALSNDAARIERLDAAFASAGVHPVADASAWRQPEVLPLQSNAVNVLVIDEAQASRLGEEEILRVLAPGHGFALVGERKLRQLRPEGMDHWHSYARDGTGNDLSRDTEVQPPNSIQWLMGPRDVRRNDPHLVTERFHVIQHGWRYRDAMNATYEGTLPKLYVRDAFSGVGRWAQFNNGGRSYPWALMSFTDGRHLFIPKHNSADLQALDLATGEVVVEDFPHLKWAEVADRPRGATHSTAYAWSRRIFTDGQRIYHVDGGNIVRAMSMDGSQLYWERRFEGEFSDMGAIDGEHLVVVTSSTNNFPFGSMKTSQNNTNIAKSIVGMDPATGEERWRYNGVEGFPIFRLAMHQGTVVAASHMDSPHRSRERAHPLRPSHAQVAGNILVSVDAASGSKHFKRTDFSDLNNLSNKQNMNIVDGRIVFNEESMAFVYDLFTGETLNEKIDLGNARNAWNAITPHWIISNGLFVSHDGSQRDDAAFRITWPQYNAFSKPANGLYYIPPGLETINGARHYGVMMAMTREELPQLIANDQHLLVRGNANGIAEPAAADWPTFRGDFLRSAYRDNDGPAALQLAWQAQVELPSASDDIQLHWHVNSTTPGPLSAPVADGQRIVVVSPDNHRLHSYDLRSGERRWSTKLGGRINAPPTLAGAVAFVGANDGTVSAINLEDGSIIWCFLAAPYERLHQAFHQLESTHPVFSSPVLIGGRLLVSAGRHGASDNGIFVWALDPATGAVLGEQVITDNHVNEILQLVDGKIRLVHSDIDPQSLQLSRTDRGASNSIIPDEGGKVGGAGWIRPFNAWRNYRAINTEGQLMRGLITQLPDGFADYHHGTFREFAFGDLRTTRKEIPVSDLMNNHLANAHLAGAGRYHYAVGRLARGDDQALRLAVIDTQDSTVQTVDVELVNGREQVISDGIAIAHGHVIVTTTAGRVLVFNAP